MDTKKIFVLIFVALFLALPSVSAWDWDNVKDYNPETKEISISSSFLWLFKMGEVARYQLTDNSDQCLRTCYAEGTAKIYETGKLFSDMEFEGGSVSDYKIFIEVDEVYYETETIKGKQECENFANLTSICSDTFTEKEVEKTRKVWQEYNGEELQGVYKWRLEGTKESKKVDWIGTAFGQRMEEWAWWDTDWSYRSPFNISEMDSVAHASEPTMLEFDSATPIAAGKMQNDCDDIRILNSTDEEVGGYNITGCDSATTRVYFPYSLSANTNETIYLYYANAGASAGSGYIVDYDVVDIDISTIYELIMGADSYWNPAPSGVNWDIDANILFDAGDGGDITYFNDTFNDDYYKVQGVCQTHGAQNTGSNTTSSQVLGRFHSLGFHVGQANIDYNCSVAYFQNEPVNFTLHKPPASTSYTYWTAGGAAYTPNTYIVTLKAIESSGLGTEEVGNTLAATLNSPVNWYNSTSKTITFNCSSTDDIGVLNLTLLIDGDDNFTITNSSAAQNLSLQTAVIISDGSHNWTCRGDDGEDIEEASVRFLTIDSTSPSINIENPINQTYIYLSDSVNISLSENASLCWYELSESLGTNTSLTNRNDSGWSSSSNISIISGGQYINVWCNDSFGNVNQSTRYYSGDSTPPSFTFVVPVQNEEFLKLETPYNITSNVSITDDAVEVCWYYTSDNSTNVTYTCNGLFNVTFTTGGNKTMYLYANDTFSNENTTSVDFFVNLISYTFTYENPTLEQIRQTITFEISTDVINSFTATNYYNGTAANTTFFSFNSTYGIISSSVVSPEVVADSEVFFYTNYTINGVNQLSTIENHSVRNVDIDNCTSYDNAILNFTMVDEELQTELVNTTMEIAVNLYDLARTSVLLNISDSYSTNPTTICLNTNVTEEATYSMDVIVRYEETQHAIEYYNIVNFILTNESELQDIILYDLNLTDSTEFQLTFIGSDYVAEEEALVYVDRKYIAENMFKTIELPKTDSNGQTILHLVRNDVVYNLRIVKNGVVLGNFENIIAFCEDATIGDCKISLNAFSSTDEIFDYDKDLGIIMSAATYNNATSIISFDFLTSDGSSKEVRMEVTKADTFGNRSVCNDTLTSSGGTIFCDVGTYNGEASLRVSIFVDDNLASFQTIELEPTDYGVIGFLFFFILVACMILIFASTGKEGVLFGMVISMALGIGLGVIRGDMIGYGAAGLWIIIIAIIGIWKLNKEKAQ